MSTARERNEMEKISFNIAIENAALNITSIEALIENQINRIGMKKAKRCLLAQQINYSEIEYDLARKMNQSYQSPEQENYIFSSNNGFMYTPPRQCLRDNPLLERIDNDLKKGMNEIQKNMRKRSYY